MGPVLGAMDGVLVRIGQRLERPLDPGPEELVAQMGLVEANLQQGVRPSVSVRGDSRTPDHAQATLCDD